MRTSSKILMVCLGLCLLFVVSYKLTSTAKTGRFMTNMNNVCGIMTDELRNNAGDDTACIDYYCYYAPYSPPEGYEDSTSTLCVCKCRKPTGEVTTHQVLGTKSSF